MKHIVQPWDPERHIYLELKTTIQVSVPLCFRAQLSPSACTSGKEALVRAYTVAWQNGFWTTTDDWAGGVGRQLLRSDGGNKQETGDLLGLVWKVWRAVALTVGWGSQQVPLPGERHQNKELMLWLRERARYLLCSLHGIFQLCCKYEKKLQRFVAKGRDRDIKADAAGCRKNNQAIYTHNLFCPIVWIAEAEGGFWFQDDL